MKSAEHLKHIEKIATKNVANSLNKHYLNRVVRAKIAKPGVLVMSNPEFDNDICRCFGLLPALDMAVQRCAKRDTCARYTQRATGGKGTQIAQWLAIVNSVRLELPADFEVGGL